MYWIIAYTGYTLINSVDAFFYFFFSFIAWHHAAYINSKYGYCGSASDWADDDCVIVVNMCINYKSVSEQTECTVCTVQNVWRKEVWDRSETGEVTCSTYWVRTEVSQYKVTQDWTLTLTLTHRLLLLHISFTIIISNPSTSSSTWSSHHHHHHHHISSHHHLHIVIIIIMINIINIKIILSWHNHHNH